MGKIKFDNLEQNNHLFTTLINNPPKWWINLTKDKSIHIEIRKDNYIDVYYNGGGIIKKFISSNGVLKGKIHFEYLPVDIIGNQYLDYAFENQSVKIHNVPNNFEDFNNFNQNILDKLEKKIEVHYPSNSEKGIQSSFILNDGFFIDSEFSYNFNNKTVRIDLVRIDINQNKIVFVELKTIGDNRLYTNEIIRQLSDYRDFINYYKDELLKYYIKLFNIKKQLGILSKNLSNVNLSSFSVLEKPLLLFGNCEQSWIDSNSNMLDSKIKDIAVGCYYFGKPKYSCDLVYKSFKNKHIF